LELAIRRRERLHSLVLYGGMASSERAVADLGMTPAFETAWPGSLPTRGGSLRSTTRSTTWCSSFSLSRESLRRQ
jgi:hypothetical protein